MPTNPPLTDDAVDDLRRRLAGDVLASDHADYAAARTVWNGMIDRRPALVVRVASVDDVAPAIAFARAHGLELAVRGGGHNVAGNGTVDGGLVLDMRALADVRVDPEARTVAVQAGATLADVDRATEPFGLAVPAGVVSATGIAGLTLGGGFGWLTRAHGLTVDNLLSANLVTAAGEQVTASATEHEELFWALRGGGGNFGVVTSFTFRAHPLGPEVHGGNLVYHQPRWPEALRAFEEWTRDLPDELTAITSTLTPPADLGMGTEPLLVVGWLWASADRAAGDEVVDRLRRAAPPDSDIADPVRWTEWQSAMDALFPHGVRAYWRNTSFDQLDDEVVAVVVRRGAEQTWQGTAFDIHHLGGAFARVPEDATPFPNRGARFWLNVYGFWADPADDAARTAFVRGFADDMERFATGGQYVNFQGREVEGHRVVDPRQVFGAEKFARLAAVKRRYDPDNVFHLNTNIPPA